MAAEAGNAIAQCDIALTYEEQGDLKEAFQWYKKSAENGDSQAQCSLGTCYWQGHGVNISIDNAIKSYLTVVDNKNSTPTDIKNSLCNLGQIYLQVQKQPKKAFEYFQLATNYKCAESQAYLGDMYDHGNGVNKDTQKAAYWYQQSAEQGVARAQFNLAEMYLHGEGVEMNHMNAMQWMVKAAEQGNNLAIEKSQEMFADLKSQGLI